MKSELQSHERLKPLKRGTNHTGLSLVYSIFVAECFSGGIVYVFILGVAALLTLSGLVNSMRFFWIRPGAKKSDSLEKLFSVWVIIMQVVVAILVIARFCGSVFPVSA
jgi:hypothetical protein